MNVFDLFAKISLDSSAFESGLKSIGKIAGGALAGATAAIGVFSAASVKTGMSFDKSMSQVAATMGKTVADLENETGKVTTTFGEFNGNLREFAQYMGQNTAFSATEAADALNYMALAGYDAQESMTMLPNVLSLASAGNMDLARASDMVTDTQTAFGLSAERTTQMVDEMAKAASTGNTSVEQLGDAFLTVGGLAQELNGGIVKLADGTTQSVDGVQELEIALTAMANAGVKGSEAGTHMRNMLLKLSSPTSDGTKQLEKLGVSVFDAEGNMRSLHDVFGDLNGSLGKLTQEQKIQAISDLFNTRDLASAEALLKAVESDWDGIGESILDAEGAASKMAETQLDNLAGDITLFKSALEGAQIAISDVLTPSLREFVQFGTEGLQKLTEAFQSDGLSGAMDVFGNLLADGLTMIVDKVPMFVDAGLQLLTALGKGLVQNMPTIIQAAIKVAQTFITGLGKALPQVVNGAGQVITQLAQGISQALPTLIPTVVEIILTIVDALIENIDVVVDAAIEITMALAEGLIAALPVLIEKVPTILAKLYDAINENGAKLIDAGVDLIKKLVVGIGSAVGQLIAPAIRAVSQFVAGISKSLSRVVAKGREIISKVVSGITGAIGRLVQKGAEIVRKVISGIVSVFGQLRRKGSDMIDAVKGGITSKISEALSWGKDLMNNFISGIKSKFGELKNAVSQAGGAIKKLMGHSHPSEGPMKDDYKWMPDMMKLFTQGIKSGSKELYDQVKKTFDFQDLLEGGFETDISDLSGDVPLDGDYLDKKVVSLREAEKGSERGSTVNNIYMTVNGAENPEDWANRFIDQFNLITRTA